MGNRGEVPHNLGFLGNVVVSGRLLGESVGLMFLAGGAAHGVWKVTKSVVPAAACHQTPHWSSSVANTNVAPERVKEITIRDLHLLPLGTSNIYELA